MSILKKDKKITYDNLSSAGQAYMDSIDEDYWCKDCDSLLEVLPTYYEPGYYTCPCMLEINSPECARYAKWQEIIEALYEIDEVWGL